MSIPSRARTQGDAIPVATDAAVDVATDAAPPCADYSKNGAGPVTDRKSCEDACYTAEGLSKPACCDLEDFKGANGTAKCDCCSGTSGGSCNSYRSVCEDPDFSNGAFRRAGSLALVSLLACLPGLV